MIAAAFLFMLAILPHAAVSSCIQEYGSVNELHATAGTHFTYGYQGMDWPNLFPACHGKRQSPVLLPATGAAAKTLGQPDAKSSFSYGVLNNPKVVNNGHTLQVSLPADFVSTVKIPIKGSAKTATAASILNGKGAVSYVKATPAQFHFHSHSEHVMSGAEYPLEMHIVHFIKPDQLPSCPAPGCPAVVGVMLALTDKEDEVKPELRKLIEAMPLNEGATGNAAGKIDVNALLPTDRTYLTYEGSLTAPPCTEGILWHVLTTPVKISQSLLMKYNEAVGNISCPGDNKKGTAMLARNTEVAEEAGPKQSEAGSAVFRPPPKDARGCVKLANGHNCRVVQPMGDRSIKLAT